MARARGRPRKQPPADFYSPAFSADLQRVLDAAREVHGLSEEIAVLRVRLRELIASGAEEREVQRAADVLVRAVTASGRLPAEDAGAVLARVSEELGGILTLLAEGSGG